MSQNSTPGKRPLDGHLFATFVPDSPKRLILKSMVEVKQFIDSPEGGKSARFKKCANEVEVEEFYQKYANSPSVVGQPLTAAAEPKLPFKEPATPLLNRFRMTIIQKNDTAFDELVNENPMYLINGNGDRPTILQGGQRHNAMHVACFNGNFYVVQRILSLVRSREFIERTYGTLTDFAHRSAHLLDCFLNTPDRVAGNTPLHFAARMGHVDIIEHMVTFSELDKKRLNNQKQTPLALVCATFKGTSKEKAAAKALVINFLGDVQRDRALRESASIFSDASDTFDDSFDTKSSLREPSEGATSSTRTSPDTSSNIEIDEEKVFDSEEDEYFDAMESLDNDDDSMDVDKLSLRLGSIGLQSEGESPEPSNA